MQCCSTNLVKISVKFADAFCFGLFSYIAGAYAKTGLDLQLIEIITGFNLRHSFSSSFDSSNIDQSSDNFVNNQQMSFEREAGLRSD